MSEPVVQSDAPQDVGSGCAVPICYSFLWFGETELAPLETTAVGDHRRRRAAAEPSTTKPSWWRDICKETISNIAVSAAQARSELPGQAQPTTKHIWEPNLPLHQRPQIPAMYVAAKRRCK